MTVVPTGLEGTSHFEYAVAGLAKSLRGPILALGDWATENRPRDAY